MTHGRRPKPRGPGGGGLKIRRTREMLARCRADFLAALAQSGKVTEATNFSWLPRTSQHLMRKADPKFEAAVQAARNAGQARQAYQAWWEWVDLQDYAPRRDPDVAAVAADDFADLGAEIDTIFDYLRKAAGEPDVDTPASPTARPKATASELDRELELELERLIEEAVSMGMPPGISPPLAGGG